MVSGNICHDNAAFAHDANGAAYGIAAFTLGVVLRNITRYGNGIVRFSVVDAAAYGIARAYFRVVAGK
ncbi:MAG: hypothetical protein LUF25_04360 [Phascolarctobacterium sp.]|nr:hypothetical protein [Phascolarctobacterium sp.]